MDFSLTKVQEELKSSLHDFLVKECPPDEVRRLEDEGIFPYDIWSKLAGMGLMGLPFPSTYGGTDGSVVDFTIVCEELSWAMSSIAHLYAMSVLFGGESILFFGTEEQKRQFLPKIINAEIRFAGSFTEPNAGSDVASLSTMAIENNKGFLINGTKVFSTGAHVADYIYLAARTNTEGPPHRGISTFLVDTKTPGLTTRRLEAMGCMAVYTNEIILEDVQIGKDTLLGDLNNGFYQIMKTFEVERIITGAMGVGLARRVFENGLQYLKGRSKSEKSIVNFQSLSHRFANLATEIDAARLIVQHAAWLKSQERDCLRESSMAKLLGTEVAKKAAREGMRTMGIQGLIRDYEMERLLRESLIGTIVAGTSEIMRNIISSTYGL